MEKQAEAERNDGEQMSRFLADMNDLPEAESPKLDQAFEDTKVVAEYWKARVEKLEAALRAIQKFGETVYRRGYAVYPDDAKAIIKLAGDGLK